MNRNNGQGRVYLDIFFKAEKWSGEPENKEPMKCERIDWFDLDCYPSNTISYVKEVLTNFYQSKTMFSESGW